MFSRVRILAVFLCLPLLTQCGSKSAPEAAAVTGPFDSSGNYREDWVNTPEKWYKPNKPTTTKKTTKKVAKREPTPAPAPRPAPTPLPTRPTVTPLADVVSPSPAVTPRVSTPRPVVSTPRPVVSKPKPKPVPVKPKPKPKPKVLVHRVQRGDNLTKLSNRYGVSVSKIKSANNLRSDVIMLGTHLKIPR